jgi:release factor glutamine methyltransferase
VNSSVARLLDEAAARLADHGEARREAHILLGHALGVSRAWLAAHDRTPVDPAHAAVFGTLLERRRSGEPVAYLLGTREFYGLNFRVTPDVLIPRPDTEVLIDAALEKLPAKGHAEVLDLGTGCGCIAVALAHARPELRVTAVDVSAAALDIARQNARTNGVRVNFAQTRWYDGLDGRRFDMIVSNPPYVASNDPHLGQGDLRYEPAVALVSGDDGLADIRSIVRGAPEHLHSRGWLLLEHGHDQAEPSRDLLRDTGFGEEFSRLDIAGLARVAGGRLTAKSANR